MKIHNLAFIVLLTVGYTPSLAAAGLGLRYAGVATVSICVSSYATYIFRGVSEHFWGPAPLRTAIRIASGGIAQYQEEVVNEMTRRVLGLFAGAVVIFHGYLYLK